LFVLCGSNMSTYQLLLARHEKACRGDSSEL
jgi:hypothetical protein